MVLVHVLGSFQVRAPALHARSMSHRKQPSSRAHLCKPAIHDLASRVWPRQREQTYLESDDLQLASLPGTRDTR